MCDTLLPYASLELVLVCVQYPYRFVLLLTFFLITCGSCVAVTFQVLHQLKRLGKVWQDVLPVNVYCKAMGTLLNTALSEIVTRIAALEVTA